MKKEVPTLGEKHISDLALLAANDDYKADMDKLSKKYNLASKGGILDGKKELEFIQDPKSIEMAREYIELMNKYGITWLYYMLMPFFVEKGYFSVLANGEQMKFDIKEATNHVLACSGVNVVENEKEYVTVKIFKDTTAKDVQKILPAILKELNKKSRRKKASKNQTRDLYALRLKNRGLTHNEITKKINANKKYTTQKMSYQEVSHIIDRLKTRAKKNVSHRES